MIYAQVIFSGFLVLFAGLTWRVYSKLASIEKQNQLAKDDPELMVEGQWSHHARDGNGFRSSMGMVGLSAGFGLAFQHWTFPFSVEQRPERDRGSQVSQSVRMGRA